MKRCRWQAFLGAAIIVLAALASTDSAGQEKSKPTFGRPHMDAVTGEAKVLDDAMTRGLAELRDDKKKQQAEALFQALQPSLRARVKNDLPMPGRIAAGAPWGLHQPQR